MSTNIESATALFELFEHSLDSNNNNNIAAMYNSSIPALDSQLFLDESKPRQVLGESVFNHFVKSEFPLGLEKIEVDELSPSVGTITPLQLHSSIVESVFSPSLENSSPMFDDVELDTENWSSLFEPSELEVPAPKKEVKVEEQQVISKPPTKRSSSEAELDLPSTKKHSSSSSSDLEESSDIDHLGVVSYNRKNRSTPLSPIVCESEDPVAQKRARNTEAARRSRARKIERMNQLEDKVESLVNKNNALQDEVLRLRALLQQNGQSF